MIAILGCCSFFAVAAEQVTIEIREPNGDRRTGHPVAVLLKLPRAVPPTTRFRLLRDGKPIVAQFRSNQSDGKSAEWWVDFEASMSPYEVQRYLVEFGPEVEPGPELSRGHTLVEKNDTFEIANAPSIAWTVPRNLKGLLRSVTYPPPENLRPDSAGLMLRDNEGNVYPAGGAGTVARIIRQGPMAVALHFEKAETHQKLQGVRWTADLVFPVPVSWVEVTWNVYDPNRRVAGMGIELRMKLDQPTPDTPTVVDLGASRTVYTTLVADEQVELQAGLSAASVQEKLSRNVTRPWKVFRGRPNQLQPFVFAPKQSTAVAEGWAYVMDRKRCLALAFDEFARRGEERINVAADGTVTAWRSFAVRQTERASDSKSLRAWLHFVEYPPQYGALSSPQSMQHPIELRLR